MNKTKKHLLVALSVLIGFSSCKKGNVISKETSETTKTEQTPRISLKTNSFPFQVKDFVADDAYSFTVVSNVPVSNVGYQLYYNTFQGSGANMHQVWAPQSGVAETITSFKGTKYVTNSLGDIYNNANGYWQQMPGKASMIRCNAIAYNNTSSPFALFCLGTEMADANGYHIYKWENNTWVQKSGSAIKIAVEPNGTLWAINASHQIFKSDAQSNWMQIPGSAIEIAVGGENNYNFSIYCLGDTQMDSNGYPIFKWTDSGWQQLEFSAVKINVVPALYTGILVMVNASGTFYRRPNGVWEQAAI